MSDNTFPPKTPTFLPFSSHFPHSLLTSTTMSNANSLPSSHGTPFTPPPVITTSAEEFTDPSDLISHISTTLDTGQKDQVLVFTGVSPSWGVNVVDSLNESHESNAIR